MSYRIKEITNSATGRRKFICQSKFIWWTTCVIELGWGCWKDAEFDSIGGAEQFIWDRQEEDGWLNPRTKVLSK